MREKHDVRAVEGISEWKRFSWMWRDRATIFDGTKNKLNIQQKSAMDDGRLGGSELPLWVEGAMMSVAE